MTWVQLSKGLLGNQTSKSISSRIEYSIVRDRLSCHGFDTVGGNENVDRLLGSILEIKFDGIFTFFTADKTVRQMDVAELGDVLQKYALNFLTMEARGTTLSPGR